MSRPVEHDDGPLLDIAAKLHVWGKAPSRTKAFEAALDQIVGPMTSVDRSRAIGRLQKKKADYDAAILRHQEAKRVAQVALRRGDVSAALATGHAFATLAPRDVAPDCPAISGPVPSSLLGDALGVADSNVGRAVIVGAGPVLPSLLSAPTGTATRTPAAFVAALRALASDIEAGRVHVADVQAELTALLGKVAQARRGGLEEPGS